MNGQIIGEFFSSTAKTLAEGPVVALLNRHFPASLVAGFGLHALRPASGATTSAEACGERLIRPDACPFCKTLVGNALTKNDLWKNIDCAICPITCDQVRHSIDRLQEDCGIPVFSVSLPALLTEAGRSWFTAGVSDVMDGLARRFGRTFDPALARADYLCRAEGAARLRKLVMACSYDPLILHRLIHAWMIASPASFLKLLDTVEPGLEVRKYDKTVLLVGGVVALEDDAVIEDLARLSIYPLPLHSAGLDALESFPPLPESLPDEALLTYLCNSVFDAPAHIRTRPNGMVYDRIKRYIAQTDAAGVILKTLSFCDLWYTEKERMRQLLPVPLLVLTGGYGEGAEGGLSTRLETFAEQMEA